MKIPAMIRRELVFSIGYQGALVRAGFFNQSQEILTRVPFDVQFNVGKGFEAGSQVVGILSLDMPLVRSGMNGDALNAKCYESLGKIHDIGVIATAGVSQQGNFIEVDAEICHRENKG